MMKNTYPFMEKSPEELAKEANKALKEYDGKEKSPEEIIEDDAEGGYYQEDENE